MWKSIIYKEWIKVRWYLIMLTLFGILVLGIIFLGVQHDKIFSNANNYWYAILFNGLQYYSILKFIPLLMGIVFAFAQFYPEIVNKRIKLTFHLPLKEDKTIMIMILFGAISLIVSYGIMFLLFLIASNFFFAREIVDAALISIMPWFLAGFGAYFLVSTIILEPIWLYRILYTLATILFIPLYLVDSVSGGYGPINLPLAVITLIISISLLFSAYRFRKGEM